MSDPISVQYESSEVEAMLERLHTHLGYCKPIMERIGRRMHENAMMRFRDQKAPDGTPWKPSIRAQKTGGQTLRKSGRLADSIRERATNDQLEQGTNLVYAPIHQLGGVIKPRNKKFLYWPGASFPVKRVVIPARPFLGISNDDVEDIRLVVAEALNEIVEGRDA